MSTPTTPAPPAGWYSDPATPGLLRYFDGEQWTAHTSTRPPAPPNAMVLPQYGGARVAPSGAHPDDVVHWLLPTGRTWQSIVAGYLGLVTLFVWPLGPVTLGFGLWALHASSAGHGHGRGRAVFAIVAGVIGCATTLLAIVL